MQKLWKNVFTFFFLLVLGAEAKSTAQEKFLVQTHSFPDQSSVPRSSDLALYWKALPPSAIKEHRCVVWGFGGGGGGEVRGREGSEVEGSKVLGGGTEPGRLLIGLPPNQ